MSRFVRFIVLPNIALLIAGVALFLVGARDAAWFVSVLGVGFYMIGLLFWIAAVDSRKRWPNEPFMVRLGSIVSFRDD